MPYIVKSKPKQYTIELDGGVFIFDAPTDQQGIVMLEAIQGKGSFATIEPIVKALLSEVREVQDQSGKALTARELKSASSLGGNLVISLAAKLITAVFAEKEAEEKN